MKVDTGLTNYCLHIEEDLKPRIKALIGDL